MGKKSEGIKKECSKAKLYVGIFLSVMLIAMLAIEFIPRGVVAHSESTIVKDDSGKEMFTVPATFYDYRSDSELYSSDGKINNCENDKFDHYAFEEFNEYIADYYKNNNMSVPLYFGDFCNYDEDNKGADLTKGVPGSATYDFKWVANRANRNDYSAAVAGLVDSNLTNGNISKDGVALPYFNEEYLTSTKVNGRSIGTAVTSVMPFRLTEDNGVQYYEFNSNGGKDNIWFDNGQLKYSSNADKHGVWNAIYAMTGQGKAQGVTDGIGFFPFNNREVEGTNDDRSLLNFGFGVKMDINFKVPRGGVVKDNNGNSQDVVFDFEGDDDVWVFVDGKLVLDLGGQHKGSKGSINFNSNKLYSIANSVITNVNDDLNQGATYNKQVSLSDLGLDFTDPTEEHKITMYYMERGMIESNMKVKFNFINTDTLALEKNVDTSNVNSALVNEVKDIASNDDFDFTIEKKEGSELKPVANKNYIMSGSENSDNLITDANGKLTLKDGQQAEFIAEFKKNDIFKICEGDNDKYTTNAVIYSGDNVIKTIDGKDTGEFTFSTDNARDVFKKIIYTNKINTGSININKKLSQYAEDNINGSGDVVFSFQVKLKNIWGNNNGSEYTAYPVKYTVGGKTKTAKDGIVKIKAGETARITGIPVGTSYTIEEINIPEGYELAESNNTEGTVTVDSSKNVMFLNGTTKYNLILQKTIDNKYYKSDDKFSNNETYEDLTSCNQSFLFTINQYDLSGNYVKTFYEVISFDKNDGLTKQRVISDLPAGYYEVIEDTSWSWKYKFKNITVTPKAEQTEVKYDRKNAKVSKVYLGYKIKTTPIVEFKNALKYTNKTHDETPEGDTDIETNTLKNN